MDAYCTECRTLWQQYSVALLKHLRLKNVRPVRPLNSEFNKELEAAERRHNELQDAIRQHERDFHGMISAARGGAMATAGSKKVQVASVVTKQVIDLTQSAAGRVGRLQADIDTNTHGVLVHPQEIAACCRAIADDFTNAANLISTTTWPVGADYCDDESGIDIPA